MGILSPRGEEEVTFEHSREACRLIFRKAQQALQVLIMKLIN